MSAGIPADGPCHWFYRNKSTGQTWGAELPEDAALPNQLVHFLARVAESRR
jgi:hypothetical protein